MFRPKEFIIVVFMIYGLACLIDTSYALENQKPHNFFVPLSWATQKYSESYGIVNAGKSETALEVAATPATNPTPTAKATVKNVIPTVAKYNCTGPDGKTFQSSEVECKKFNDSWSKPKPTNPPKQGTTNQQPSAPSGSSYTSPSAYSCTICYHYATLPDSCLTWPGVYKSKAECDAEQAKQDSTRPTPYPTSPPTPSTPVYSVEQCKADVMARYEPLFQGCNQYAGGARDACIQINTSGRNSAIAACN